MATESNSLVHKSGRQYRVIGDSEIESLIAQGCSSDDWSGVKVVPGFKSEFIRNCHFSGKVKLGLYQGKFELSGGLSAKSGIYNAWLNNCIIEDNVLIFNIGSYISNYRIEEGVVIHNVNSLIVDGKCTFGNGIRVKVINEQGGRDVLMYDHLNTHIAYILAMYRHRKTLKEKIEKLINDYVRFVTSDMGVVSKGASIINCDNIRNVKVGEYAKLEGVRKLMNGSIISCIDDPVTIGDGVIMENFIVNSGSRIGDATLITNCFIGQGCHLDKHYSAVESLFFANCQGFHGEACSIFAGPYTVTHHKSTLLIAGLFSFLNAGSGSNQSNHMYKLGPIHQGVVERGVKTTSDSYLLWPSRVGAFSLVMGRHYKHSDTSAFPFSYLIENRDDSYLVPAVNLKSIGTIRDSRKWPRRDVRKDPNLLDQINFNLLSPYTVQKMIMGHEILLGLRSDGQGSDDYQHEGMKIRKSALEKGIKLYDMAIIKFLGNSLITRLQSKKLTSVTEMRESFVVDTPVGSGKWVDLSGLICPMEAIKSLFIKIESGDISSLEEINATLGSLHNNYYSFEWTWAAATLKSYLGIDTLKCSLDDLLGLVEKWKAVVLEIDDWLYEDAAKEYSLHARTGFGVDGEAEERELDFEMVRGDFETSSVVSSIKEHKETKKKLGDKISLQLNELKNK